MLDNSICGHCLLDANFQIIRAEQETKVEHCTVTGLYLLCVGGKPVSAS